MDTVVVGGGRLGRALALRSHRRGHRTRILVRDPSQRLHESPVTGLDVEGIRDSRATADVVIIAAPAGPDAGKERLIEEFLVRQRADTGIFSFAAYAGTPHDRWAFNRRYLRLLCTPAAADPLHPALVIGRSGGEALQVQFTEWFGPGEVFFAEEPEFSRLAGILMATVVHLETLRQFCGEDDASAAPAIRSVGRATLAEANALLALFGGSSAQALESCATPGGLTLQIAEIVRPAIKEAVAAT